MEEQLAVLMLMLLITTNLVRVLFFIDIKLVYDSYHYVQLHQYKDTDIGFFYSKHILLMSTHPAPLSTHTCTGNEQI